MKSVISDKSTGFVNVNDLIGNELIAYRSKTSSETHINYCVLFKVKRIHQNSFPTVWEFMCLGKMDRQAVFVGYNAIESIKSAISAGRDVKTFSTQEEMLEAMHKKTF